MVSAILWKRARNPKADHASKIGREVVCSPTCKEGQGQKKGEPRWEEEEGGSQSTAAKGGKGKPPIQAKVQITNRKRTICKQEKIWSENGEETGKEGDREEEEKRCSQIAKTMSKISLLVNLTEATLVGVGALANSWVMTGMAIVVKGMTMTNRNTRLALKRVSGI